MIKKILPLLALALTILSCGEEKDPFLIEKGSIGPLQKQVQMRMVDSIFALDSVVQLSSIENVLGRQGEVEIYDKAGAKLLLLSPEDESDPNSVITNIQVFDSRYKTATGLNLNSTFADVRAQYEIEDIQSTINSVVIFLKDSDIYLTIDKKELPANVRYNPSAKIEETQIPDTATFKYFMLGWDPVSDDSADE